MKKEELRWECHKIKIENVLGQKNWKMEIKAIQTKILGIEKLKCI